MYGARKRGAVYEVYHQSLSNGFCVVNGMLFDQMLGRPAPTESLPVCQVLFAGDKAVLLDFIQSEDISKDIQQRYSPAAYQAYLADYADGSDAFYDEVMQEVEAEYQMQLRENTLYIDTDSGAYTITAVFPQVNTVKGNLEK